MLAAPPSVVIVPLVPAIAVLSVAVTVCTVAATVFVVKTIVAMPLALVTDVAAENDPPPLLDQVIVLPTVATELLFPSASWANSVTGDPATGVEAVEVTIYFVAGAAVNGTSALLLMPTSPAVAEMFAPPMTVPTVSVAVKFPPPLFVTALRDPIEFVSETTGGAATKLLPFASLSCTVIIDVLDPLATRLVGNATTVL